MALDYTQHPAQVGVMETSDTGNVSLCSLTRNRKRAPTCPPPKVRKKGSFLQKLKPSQPVGVPKEKFFCVQSC